MSHNRLGNYQNASNPIKEHKFFSDIPWDDLEKGYFPKNFERVPVNVENNCLSKSVAGRNFSVAGSLTDLENYEETDEFKDFTVDYQS